MFSRWVTDAHHHNLPGSPTADKVRCLSGSRDLIRREDGCPSVSDGELIPVTHRKVDSSEGDAALRGQPLRHEELAEESTLSVGVPERADWKRPNPVVELKRMGPAVQHHTEVE